MADGQDPLIDCGLRAQGVLYNASTVLSQSYLADNRKYLQMAPYYKALYDACVEWSRDPKSLFDGAESSKVKCPAAYEALHSHHCFTSKARKCRVCKMKGQVCTCCNEGKCKWHQGQNKNGEDGRGASGIALVRQQKTGPVLVPIAFAAEYKASSLLHHMNTLIVGEGH